MALRRLARGGTDPANTARSEPLLVINGLINRYTIEHLRRNTEVSAKVEQLLNLHVVSRWGEREVTSITRGDFIALLEQVRQPAETTINSVRGIYRAVRGGPGSAGEVRKWVRAMFQFAVEQDILPMNPLSDVRNRDFSRPRDRVLTMEELRIVWKATDQLEYPWRPYFQLLMLSGDRRGEWANAKRSWLSPDGTRLEIPSKSYKTRKIQVVPFSRQVMAIVESLPTHTAGEFLLSTTGGAQPIAGFNFAKSQLNAAISAEHNAPFEHWVVHDLRRSMATHMERIGVEPHVIELCIGHKLKGIGATYRHYSYFPEKAVAFQLWADELVPQIAQIDLAINIEPTQTASFLAN